MRAYGEFFAKEIPKPRCCDGLARIARDEVIDTAGWYEGDDYPDGCAPGNAPPDLFVCLPCGNGTCDDEEHFCNCAEDCPAP